MTALWRRHPGPLSVAALAAATAVALSTVSGLSRYQVTLAVSLAVLMVLAQAWNIIAGYSGAISLGVGTFVGVGGYTAGLLMIHQGIGIYLAIAAGAAAAAALGALLSIPLLRLRGFYFAVGTLAATVTLQALFVNWRFAGGSTGITVPIASVPDDLTFLRIAIVLVFIATSVAVFLRFSSFGLRVVAIRDHEMAAVGLGLGAFRYRVIAFVLSSTLTGAAGALIAVQQITIEPDGMFNITWTLNAVLMTTVGGAGTVLGPLLGVLIIDYGLTQQLERYQALSLIVEGALLIVIVRFAPQGVGPLLGRAARGARLRARGGGPGEPADDGPPAEPGLLASSSTGRTGSLR